MLLDTGAEVSINQIVIYIDDFRGFQYEPEVMFDSDTDSKPTHTNSDRVQVFLYKNKRNKKEIWNGFLRTYKTL